jgi:hypothetical protein
MAMTLDGSNGVTFNDASLQGAAASPFGLKNRIINGDMRIDQRNAGASVTFNQANSGFYSVDRFNAYCQQATGAFTAQQDTTVPTLSSGAFVNSLKFTVSNTTAPGSTNRVLFRQIIEGLNVADLGWGSSSAATVTLSFWVRSSVTGTYGVGFINSAENRSYVGTYTISSANTWEQKTITVPGDTTGTWLTNNSNGIRVAFDLGSGSSFNASSSGTWVAQEACRTSSCVNWQQNSGATFYITGVQLEVGSTATPFERRLYGQELANCQRYYYRNWYNTGNTARLSLVAAFNATRTFGGMSVPVPMRATPTLSYGSNTYFQLETLNLATTYAITNFNIFSTANTTSNNLYSIEINVASGLTAGNVYHVSLLVTSGSATLGYYDFSSEL